MHLVYLGIVHKNIFLWLLGPLKTRLPSQVVAAISKSFVSLAPHVSRDFSRKPRPLEEVKMWKATEFRQFLFYTGSVVLYKKLSSKMFHNFVLLSVAMRFLLLSNKGPFTFSYIQQLIEMFVKNFAKIYSSQVLTSNVYSLLHIADDANLFVSLDNISCFPFKNYLCTLKQLISKHQQKNPIPQIIRRPKEKNLANASTNLESDEIVNCCWQQHYGGPLLQGFETFNQFKQYKTEELLVTAATGDNCICVGGSICVVKNKFHPLLVQYFQLFLNLVKKKSFCPTNLILVA